MALTALGMILPAGRWRAAPALILAGLGALAAARPILASVWRVEADAVLAVASLGAVATGWTTARGWAPSRADVAVAVGVALLGARFAGVEWLLGGALLAAVPGALGWGGAEATATSAGGPSRAWRVGGVLGAAAVVTVASTGWAVARAAVDPSPEGAWALLGAAAAGAVALPGPGAVGRARWGWGARLVGAGIGVVALVWAGGLASALSRLAPLGPVGLAWVGLTAGLLVGALSPGRWVPVAAVLGLAPLPWLLPAIPGDLAVEAARPRATLLGDAGRGEALARVYAEWSPAFAGVGAGGATAAWRRDPALLLALDGTPADPATRAGAAERFVGVLAGCLAAEPGRARVGGDDLGLALSGLRDRGFGQIDVATPDPALLRAVADARPALAQLWLAPGVRLVPLPAPAVLRLGEPADAVVHLVRSPWADARGAAPERALFADVARTLSPGGVYVLGLVTSQIPPAQVAGVLRAFVRAFPGASLWLPPEGADTAVLVGPRDPAPIPWATVERCVATPAARSLGLRDPLDLAGLALTGPDGLRAVPDPAPLWFGLPPPSPVPGPAPLAVLPWSATAPAELFDAAAPKDALDARHQTLLGFLSVLRASASGAIEQAVDQARALSGAPGGNLALVPLIRPQLDQVRSAMARANREGPGSRAWEEAEIALTSARVLAPDYPETRCVEGQLATARQQVPRAEEAFTACLRGDPGNLDALDGLATIRRDQGNLTGLEALLREAQSAHPDRWTTAHNLGFFLFNVGRHEEARKWLLDGAAQNAKLATPDPAPHLALAHLYLATGEPALALAEAVRATELRPTAEAAFLRGAARHDLGQYELAAEEFQAALRLDPEDLRARGGLGLVQARRGDYASAAESFKAVLAVDPRNAAAAENLRKVQEALAGGE